MFNVFLPKLLEMRSSEPGGAKTLEDNLWDVMIFTIGGTPGAIVRLLHIRIYISILIVSYSLELGLLSRRLGDDCRWRVVRL
jgi:hypothetical protein